MTKPILIGESWRENGKRYGIYECPHCRKHWKCATGNIESGNTKGCKSCASIRNGTIHGKNGSREYNAYQHMHDRCYNTSSKDYKNYGARGITVCERWFYFENFHEDMGDVPEGMSLDRIDNDGHYCKANCKWSTSEEQNRNKRSNVYLTDNSGVTKLLVEWAEIKEISAHTLYMRVYNYGYTEHEAIHGR